MCLLEVQRIHPSERTVVSDSVNRRCGFRPRTERFFVVTRWADAPTHDDGARVDVFDSELVEVTAVGDVELMSL